MCLYLLLELLSRRGAQKIPSEAWVAGDKGFQPFALDSASGSGTEEMVARLLCRRSGIYFLLQGVGVMFDLFGPLVVFSEMAVGQNWVPKMEL